MGRQRLSGHDQETGLSYGFHRLWRAVIAILTAWLIASCGTSLPTPEPVTLTIVAAHSVTPLANELAAGYQVANPHVAVRVEPVGGSLAAETWLAQGWADTAFTTRWPQIATQQPLTATQVAWDAVALIVAPSLPLDKISLGQIQRIFTGKLQNWSELGAATRTIQIAAREDGSGLRSAFDAATLGGNQLTPTALILPGDDQMLDFVARTPGAIGYASVAWLSAVSSVESSPVRVLTVDGLAADPQTGTAAGYPLLLPIYAVTLDNPDAQVAAFLAWVQSPRGQRIVQQRYGVVDAIRLDS